MIALPTTVIVARHPRDHLLHLQVLLIPVCVCLSLEKYLYSPSRIIGLPRFDNDQTAPSPATIPATMDKKILVNKFSE